MEHQEVVVVLTKTVYSYSSTGSRGRRVASTRVAGMLEKEEEEWEEEEVEEELISYHKAHVAPDR